MAPQKLSMDNSGNLYISDSNGFVWLLDFRTGYIRAIAANGTVCTNKTDSLGDGCPATQASFGSNGGNGFGAGVDSLGNLYIADSTNGLIRKVITGLVSPSTSDTATTPLSLPVQIHFAPGDTLASSNGLAYTSSEWTLGTPVCTTNADNTTDCLLTSAFKPKVPGLRSTPLTVNSSLSNTANLALIGIGSGAGATLDPAKQINFGTGLSVTGLATDNAGNVYVSDANSRNILRFTPSSLTQGSGATSTTLATLTAPSAVAIDARGYVYAADTSTGLITQIAPSGTVSALPITFTNPAGLAVDALNNLYVSGSSAHVVTQINPITGVKRTLNLGTLVSPKGLAIDPSGNLLVADPGVPAIYRYNFATGTRTTVSTTASAPSAVVTDAAGNLLIADTSDILAVPAGSHSSAFTVATLAPSALAIDSAGNLYTGSNGGVLDLVRTQASAQFAGPSAPSQAFTMLESGNQALSPASLAQSDSTYFSLTAAASTDCTVNAGNPTALSIGGVCALSASYTPTAFLITTDTVTVSGAQNAALSTPSSVQLVLTGPATAPASSITISSFSPASPVYGQSVTVYATVSGSTPPPAGNVVFTLDGTTTYSGTVNSSGVASASLPSLSAGAHSVSAAYTSSNGYAPSATQTVQLTVNPAPVTATAGGYSGVYDGSSHALSACQVTGAYTGSLTCSNNPTGPVGPGVGSGTITPSVSGDTLANYSITSNSGSWSITQASSTVTVNCPSSVTYNGTAQTPCTASVTGVGSLSQSLTVSYSNNTTAGSATARATFAGDANHTGSSNSAGFTINKAPLTVTAVNISKIVGTANPTFTASYSGFVNGETTAVLSGSPVLSTTATTSSPIGTYPITIAQGTLSAANYTVTFVNGTLNVVAAPTIVLSTTATLTKVSGGYQAQVTVTNTGTGPAANVQLTAATLGSATGSPLPLSLGTLAAGGGSASVMVNFPSSAGVDGAAVAEKYSGSYTGGTFSVGIRATLP
jgi:sugar lactone lactonase YvrE